MTYVAGFRAWLKLGYCVRRGSTSHIRVWAPCPPSKEKLQAWRDAGAVPADRPRTYYRLEAVFSQAQAAAGRGAVSGSMTATGFGAASGVVTLRVSARSSYQGRNCSQQASGGRRRAAPRRRRPLAPCWALRCDGTRARRWASPCRAPGSGRGARLPSRSPHRRRSRRRTSLDQKRGRRCHHLRSRDFPTCVNAGRGYGCAQGTNVGAHRQRLSGGDCDSRWRSHARTPAGYGRRHPPRSKVFFSEGGEFFALSPYMGRDGNVKSESRPGEDDDV